jgi:hypothetical protein
MPFKSQDQRAYMHIHHPRIAARWEEHTPKDKKLPKQVKKTAYYLGRKAACVMLKLSAQDATHLPPDYASGPDGPPGPPQDPQVDPNAPQVMEDALLQQLAAQQLDPGENQGKGSDEFADFAQKDNTDQVMDGSAMPATAGNTDEKPTHWSGNASLEGGDAGTRNYQMGLPRFGGT